jgi:mannosyltransferase
MLAVVPMIVIAFFERTQISYLQTNGDDPAQYYYSLWFGSPPVALACWPFILIALGAAAVAWRRGRRSERGDLPDPAEPRAVSAIVAAAAWLFLPTLALLAVNAVFPMYTARYSTFAAPAAALLVSEGLLVVAGWARRTVGGGRTVPVAAVAVTTAGVLALLAVTTPEYLSQRGPFSKNDSDWSQVSAVVGAHAHPGDAVVFDETARPSRRPRLAMHTYPSGFTGLRDVALRTPYAKNNTWYDRAYTVTKAGELGLFAGVDRVWLLEYSFEGVHHTYGLADLERLGFKPTGVRIQTHRTLVMELQR